VVFRTETAAGAIAEKCVEQEGKEPGAARVGALPGILLVLNKIFG
jgi:hypothetical protein